jgi:hypothetical protein
MIDIYSLIPILQYDSNPTCETNAGNFLHDPLT